jgi:hypothetical protein
MMLYCTDGKPFAANDDIEANGSVPQMSLL